MEKLPSSEHGPHGAQMVSRHWALIAVMLQVMADVMNCVGGVLPDTLSHATYRYVQTELARAEAMMRRVLVLIAVTMNLPEDGPASKPKRPKDRNSDTEISDAPNSPKKRAPMFSLVDPINPSTEKTVPIARPRIRTMFHSPPPPAPPMPVPPTRKYYAPTDQRPAEKLTRRFAALQHVMENPGLHTARMARWLRKRQPRPNAKRQGRPIRFGPAPAASKRRQGLGGLSDYIVLTVDAHMALSQFYLDTS